jgi:hypothetical protein
MSIVPVFDLDQQVEQLQKDMDVIVRWWLIHMPRDTVQPGRDLVNSIIAKYALDIPSEDIQTIEAIRIKLRKEPNEANQT